jgi:hypothetical protein
MPALAERIRAYQPQPDPVAQKLQELQIAELEGKIALEQAKTIKLQAEAENIALDTQMDADGTSHERNVETMGAQASGNRDLEVTKALLKGEAPVGNIEAGVGFNKMTDDADRIRASQKKQIQPAQEQFPGPVPQDPNALPNVLPQEELATNPDLGQIPQ